MQLLSKRRALLVLVAAVCLGQSAIEIFPPEVRRIGDRLACLCKTCVETVGQCPMLQCHYSSPARQRIAALAKAGRSDDDIVDVFVQEQGNQALAMPPNEGFNSLAWLMPWIAAAFGLGAIAWYVKRYSKPAPAAEIAPEELDRFHEQMKQMDKDIEKDLADHD